MDLRPLFLALLVSPVTGVWWAVSSQILADPNVMCRRTRRLRPKLAETCRKEPELVKELAKGAQIGTRECQYQFRHRRWNCTTSRRSLRRVLLTDTRESGFVNAITAAGITFALARACSSSSLSLFTACSCDPMGPAEKNKILKKKFRKNKTNEIAEDAGISEWRWRGCEDNVNFGLRKSKEWMDARYRKRGDFKTLVMLHNNEAGRLAVKNYMKLECKCHGLSGSCTLRTCWKKMPAFRDIGNRLKEYFDGAIKVLPSNDGLSFIPAGDESIKPPGREDLVYSEDSPDFCKYNERTGSLGTEGRVCNESSAGVGGCDLLCCGRGHDSRQIKVKVNCRCRFHWCCEVTCDTCHERRLLHTCR